MAFDSIHRGKMEQILLAYDLPKETVIAIMMLYKNTKVKVCSLDGDTDYFVIVAGVLQGDTLAPYLFTICLGYVLRTSIDLMKENSFKLARERSRRYPTQTITCINFFIICQDYALRMSKDLMKENGFKLAKDHKATGLASASKRKPTIFFRGRTQLN